MLFCIKILFGCQDELFFSFILYIVIVDLLRNLRQNDAKCSLQLTEKILVFLFCILFTYLNMYDKAYNSSLQVTATYPESYFE